MTHRSVVFLFFHFQWQQFVCQWKQRFISNWITSRAESRGLLVPDADTPLAAVMPRCRHAAAINLTAADTAADMIWPENTHSLNPLTETRFLMCLMSVSRYSEAIMMEQTTFSFYHFLNYNWLILMMVKNPFWKSTLMETNSKNVTCFQFSHVHRAWSYLLA